MIPTESTDAAGEFLSVVAEDQPKEVNLGRTFFKKPFWYQSSNGPYLLPLRFTDEKEREHCLCPFLLEWQCVHLQTHIISPKRWRSGRTKGRCSSSAPVMRRRLVDPKSNTPFLRDPQIFLRGPQTIPQRPHLILQRPPAQHWEQGPPTRHVNQTLTWVKTFEGCVTQRSLMFSPCYTSVSFRPPPQSCFCFSCDGRRYEVSSLNIIRETLSYSPWNTAWRW